MHWSGLQFFKPLHYEIDSISYLKKTESLVLEKTVEILGSLASYLGLSIGEDEMVKFYQSVSDSQYNMAFQMMEKRHKVMTVFASKGLEFDQVISFSRYYKIHNEEDLQNHYVSITRAKEKFIMIVDKAEYYNHVLSIARKCGLKDQSKLFRYIK